jgi:hypothetical protein
LSFHKFEVKKKKEVLKQDKMQGLGGMPHNPQKGLTKGYTTVLGWLMVNSWDHEVGSQGFNQVTWVVFPEF